MTRFFVHTWRYAEAKKEKPGVPLSYAAGSQFTRRGVMPGDQVFIMAIHLGGVWLVGRFEVGLVAGRSFAADLLGEELFPAAEYLVASAGSVVNLQRLTDDAARALRFAGTGGPKGLAFTAQGRLDPQTLRGFRELVPESADILTELTGPMVPCEPKGAQRCLLPRRDGGPLFALDGPAELGK